jgi:hypothetical protein
VVLTGRGGVGVDANEFEEVELRATRETSELLWSEVGENESMKEAHPSASRQIFATVDGRSDSDEVALSRRSTFRSEADRLEGSDELVLTELVAAGIGGKR